MKFAKKLFPLLLCVLMLVAAFALTVSAAGGETNVSMEFSTTDVKVGDTFTVTAKYSDMSIAAFACKLQYDTDLLECTKIVGGRSGSRYESKGFLYDGTDYWAALAMSTPAEANKIGQVGFAFVDQEEYEYVSSTVYTVTFKAKAAGTATFTLIEDSSGTDGYKDTAATQTLTIKEPTPEHTCTLNLVTGQAAACEAAGWKDYYECTDVTCSKTYSDAEGKNEITDILAWKSGEGAIPATNHNMQEKVAAKAPTCVDDGNTARLECANGCGKTEGGEVIPATGEHTGGTADCINEAVCSACGNKYGTTDPANHFEPNHFDRVEATCYKVGNIEYWWCGGCTKYYRDAECKIEITQQDTVIPVSDVHTPGEPEETVLGEADCTNPGSKQIIVYCEVCNEELSNKVVEIPALDHKFTNYVSDNNASCTADGTKTAECDNGCGTTDTVTDADSKTGHDMQKTADQVDATCETAGTTAVYVCAYGCGKTEGGEVIPATDHAYGTAVTGWYELNGDWYYGDMSVCDNDESHIKHTPVKGLQRVPYPTVAINGVTYAPNAEDIEYADNHADSPYTDENSALFIFDNDGKFKYDVTGVGPHISGDEGVYSYAVNGMIPWHVGLVEDNGVYYYFKGDVNGGGNVMATGKVYATRNYNTELTTGDAAIYFFAEDGKMKTADGITEIDGTLYYYDNNRLAIGAGLIKVGDDYYYVRSSGEIVVGTDYWVVNNNDLLEKGMYTFDAEGKIVIDPATNYEGIVEIDGNYYYYVDGVKQVGAGVVEMTDDAGDTYYIYVRSNGQLATGEYWPTTLNGKLERGCYDWGTDGKYYPAD